MQQRQYEAVQLRRGGAQQVEQPLDRFKDLRAVGGWRVARRLAVGWLLGSGQGPLPRMRRVCGVRKRCLARVRRSTSEA